MHTPRSRGKGDGAKSMECGDLRLSSRRQHQGRALRPRQRTIRSSQPSPGDGAGRSPLKQRLREGHLTRKHAVHELAVIVMGDVICGGCATTVHPAVGHQMSAQPANRM